MTEWRPVIGFEGFYEVSDEGQVRSMPRTVTGRPGAPLNLRGRVLKQTPNRDGYLTVGLCRDNTKLSRKVHRVVLEAFVGVAPPGTEACHANDNKADNRLANLRWDTRSANTYDRIRNGKHHSARKTHCPAGHPYDEDNTRRTSHGRQCRKCSIANKRRYRERLAERTAA